MYQNVTLIGRLGRDPEMRYTPAGDPVTNFSLAISRKVDGKDQTMWVRITAWGKQAENCNTFLTKGQLVFVTGRLEFDTASGGPKTFTRNDGSTGAAFEITAHEVKFLSPKPEGAAAEAAEDAPEAAHPPTRRGPRPEDVEDNIPF
jgi:single-strand DNA-binding protein